MTISQLSQLILNDLAHTIPVYAIFLQRSASQLLKVGKICLYDMFMSLAQTFSQKATQLFR